MTNNLVIIWHTSVEPGQSVCTSSFSLLHKELYDLNSIQLCICFYVFWTFFDLLSNQICIDLSTLCAITHLCLCLCAHVTVWTHVSVGNDKWLMFIQTSDSGFVSRNKSSINTQTQTQTYTYIHTYTYTHTHTHCAAWSAVSMMDWTWVVSRLLIGRCWSGGMKY